MFVRKSRMFFCSLLVLIAVTSVQPRDCPSPCTCQGTSVTCTNFNEFPNGPFPERTEVISLSRGNVSKIPTGAFRGLLRLRRLSLFQVSVGEVEGCVLNGLSDLQELEFRQVTLQELQSYALSDLGSLGTLRLEECNLITVQSRALHNISSLGSLQLQAVALQTVHSEAFSAITELQNFSAANIAWGNLNNNAFHNISIGNLAMENMTIHQLGCGFLETLSQNSETVKLTNIVLPCPCHNQQLLRDVIDNPDVYGGVFCLLPLSSDLQPLASACQVSPDDPGVPGVCQSEATSQTRPFNCIPVRVSAAILKSSVSPLQLLLLLIVVILA